jgi:hypothetical protein
MTMSVVIILSYILNFAPAREHIENMFIRYLLLCQHYLLPSFCAKVTFC